MLRRLAQQLPLQQLCLSSTPQACASDMLIPAAKQHVAQLQLVAQYSQRLNPKQQKREQKKDKKSRKQDTQAGSAAAAAAESTSFSEESQEMEADVTKLVLQAINNVTPVLDVRPIRTATKVNYVPGLMPPKKARSLALHWLVRAADARAKASKATYAECLALELLLAYQKKGAARQKRDDIHKLALQNRANIHLRWW